MIILVADDDKLSRFTMKSMLGEILDDEYTVLEAANGKQMIEICKEKVPDIVFADIKMPYISGIDAIAECKNCGLDISFVIVSGYSDFEVAQRALQLEVQDYLLKPVDEEKLSRVIEKLRKKIAGNKEESNSRFQLELFHAFNYFSTLGPEAEYEEKHSGGDFAYEVIGVKCRYPKKNREGYLTFQKDMIGSMYTFGRQLLKKGGRCSHIYSDEGILFFVFYAEKEGRAQVQSFVKRLSLKYRKPEQIVQFMCFSGKNIREVYRGCEEIDACLGIEMNYPSGTVVDFERIAISENGKEILKQIYKILDAWEHADAVIYKEYLYRLYRKYQNTKVDIDLESVSRYCSNLMGQHVRSENFKEFCISLVECFDLIFGNAEKDENDIVEKVQSYVERNYMNDIGVGNIADLFDITPNYLSTIFHQKAGCRFTDYLTRVRITHAEKLLVQNRTASINDIAVMSGYNSSRYFTMVFQKVTGEKPSEYRKKLRA